MPDEPTVQPLEGSSSGSVPDDLPSANAPYAADFALGQLGSPPSRHLAVVACMDARILPLALFGLEPGDAHVIRNAGGRVTDDVIRSLLVSVHVLGVRAIAVVHHTECGMARYRDGELAGIVEEATGQSAAGIAFQAIDDSAKAMGEDLERIRSSKLFPPGIEVRGYVYDVRSGLVSETA